MSFPTTPILDTFVRANENPLSGGGKWAEEYTGYSPFQLLSDAVLGTGMIGNSAYWTPQMFGPDEEVYMDITVLPAAGVLGFVMRDTGSGSATPSGYSILWANLTTPTWTVYTQTSGVSNPIFTFSAPLLAGDSVGASIRGPAITVYRKTSGVWAPVFSVEDSTFRGAGHIGMISLENTATFDNFGDGDDPCRKWRARWRKRDFWRQETDKTAIDISELKNCDE